MKARRASFGLLREVPSPADALRLAPQPKLCVIPATIWSDPGRPRCLVGRDYPGGKSEPEWGISISSSTWEQLVYLKISEAVAHRPCPARLELAFLCAKPARHIVQAAA
jgi:hypothetical protein